MNGIKSRRNSSIVGIFQDVVGRLTANMSLLNDPGVRVQSILITREPTALYFSQWLTLIIALRISAWVETGEQATVQFLGIALRILPWKTIPSGCPKTPLLLEMMRFL